MAVKQLFRRKFVILSLVLLIVIIGGVAAFMWVTNRQQPAPRLVSANNGYPAKPAAAANSVVKTQAPNPTSDVPGGTTGANVGNEPTLVAPSGSFVSNHSPSVSDQDGRGQEESSCITTLGATCSISFAKDGQTVALPAKTLGSGGKGEQDAVASWDWSPASLGLTQGTWSITATASLNGQTKTTKDQLNLTVVP